MEKTSISKEETKNIASQFNNYKTILNNRDLGESRSFFLKKIKSLRALIKDSRTEII